MQEEDANSSDFRKQKDKLSNYKTTVNQRSSQGNPNKSKQRIITQFSGSLLTFRGCSASKQRKTFLSELTHVFLFQTNQCTSVVQAVLLPSVCLLAELRRIVLCRVTEWVIGAECTSGEKADFLRVSSFRINTFIFISMNGGRQQSFVSRSVTWRSLQTWCKVVLRQLWGEAAQFILHNLDTKL